MNKKNILIDNIPALIWGEDSDRVYIYVHGKMGYKEEAEDFARIAVTKGYQVISFDLPEHGERKDEKYSITVWNGVNDLKHIGNYVLNHWKEINLYACSIGAYFSLLAYKNMNIKKCLFQCPVLDMEKVIINMMEAFKISEEQLEEEKEIITSIGENLYWDYLIYVREHPIDKWEHKTYILYPSNDALTDKITVDDFVDKYSANLTVLKEANHYFTEPKYLKLREVWLENTI